MKDHYVVFLMAALSGVFWQLADQSAAQENHLMAILMRMVSFFLASMSLSFLFMVFLPFIR